MFRAIVCVLAGLFIANSAAMEYLQKSDLYTGFEVSGDLKLTEKKQRRRYLQYEGEFSLMDFHTDEKLDFEFLLYKPKKHVKNLIVLTPNIGGITPLESRIAYRLANEGFLVVIPFNLEEKVIFDDQTGIRLERTLKRNAVGTLKLVDELLRINPSLPQESVGLVGASQGGIRSSMLYGLDFRFKAMFIAVAGGDLPTIYERTEISVLVDFRNEHKEVLGIEDDSEYGEYLRNYMVLDPLMVTNSPHLQNVAMVIAQKDTIVPAKNQWLLWQAIKDTGVHPKTYLPNTGHVRGALELIIRENTIVDWMKTRLN